MNTLRLSELSDALEASHCLTKSQLVTNLKTLAGNAYQAMLRTRFVGEIMKRPFQKEEKFSDRIMESLHQYIQHLQLLGDVQASISSIARPLFMFQNGSDWKQAVSELVSLHTEIKNQILGIFIQYKEADFPDTFSFLRKQLFLHEEQLWAFRQVLKESM